MNNEARITQILEGRGFNVVAAVMLAVAAMVCIALGNYRVSDVDSGWCLPSCNLWIGGGWLSMLLNVACVISMGYLLKLLNRLHGFIRANASIALSVFLMLEIATPVVLANFFEGTAVLVVVAVGASLLFDTYDQRVSQRSVFLVSALLSFYTMFQFMSLYLIAVFMLGFMQMRVLRLRGFVAMLLGLFTPYWILYGFGIISFSDFNLPEVRPVWQLTDVSWQLVITCAATAFATLSLMMSNMMRIISYNAKRRACNGFFSVLTIATIVMMCIDSSNAISYLPTLNLCFAVQAGHAFTISNNEKRYILILALFALCLGMYIYNIL